MKKIINGKIYNTETAELIGEGSSDVGRSDFHYYEESLYRTPKNAFFLVGEGGALSRWSRPSGNNGYTGGSGIEPLDADEALEWAEQHCTTTEIEAAFGDNLAEA